MNSFRNRIASPRFLKALGALALAAALVLANAAPTSVAQAGPAGGGTDVTGR